MHLGFSMGLRICTWVLMNAWQALYRMSSSPIIRNVLCQIVLHWCWIHGSKYTLKTSKGFLSKNTKEFHPAHNKSLRCSVLSLTIELQGSSCLCLRESQDYSCTTPSGLYRYLFFSHLFQDFGLRKLFPVHFKLSLGKNAISMVTTGPILEHI